MLTLDQAIAYRTKTVSEFEELMVSRKWELLRVEKPGATTLGTIGFAYNKSSFDDKAEGFATLLYNDYNKNYNRLSIQVVSPKVYSSSLARIKSLGGKLLSSDVEDGEITKVYQIKNTVIKVITGTKSEDFEATQTKYIFILYALKDYNAIIADKTETEVTVDTSFAYEVDEGFYKDRDRAKDLLEQKNYKGAIMYYLDAIKTNRFEEIDYYSLGDCYYYLEQYTNAIKYYNLFYKQNPTDLDVVLSLSTCYFNLQNIKMAIQFQMKACNILDSYNHNSTLAWYLTLDKQYSKAYDYITKAEELYDGNDDDKFYEIQVNKAHIYLLDKRFESAKLIYMKYKGNIVNNSTWENMVEEDFEIMKKYKIINQDIEKIKAMLR
jgi:tetratricopeptide (TPR) repeat protein